MRIGVDHKFLKQIKIFYKAAVDNNEKSFMMNGELYHIDYAKYMIQYLESLDKSKPLNRKEVKE